MPKGLTTTAGISIIAIAIVAVGVAIYFVYTSTQDTVADLVIKVDERVVIEAGKTQHVTGSVSGGDARTPILFTISTITHASVQSSVSELKSGDTFSLTFTGNTVGEEQLTLTATQGSKEQKKTVTVKVFSANQNANTPTNSSTNTPANTNSVTNTSSPTGTFIDGNLNITFSYPAEWGEKVIPELINYAPTEGNIRIAYFSNVNRIDIPGYVSISGVTTDYVPTQSAGTPYWFAGKITPTASIETIHQQIAELGYISLQTEKVNIGNIQAIRMYNYRGTYNHYLDVTYLIPYRATEQFITLMISRSLEILAPGDASVETAVAAGETLLADIESRQADADVLRRVDQLDGAVTTLSFIQ